MPIISSISDHAAAPCAAPLEILAFTLGREEYGIDIQTVQELRGYDNVTRLANAPAFIKGVANLRGTIVPIIDLRIKFGLARMVYDQFTVVIVLNLGGRVIGMVVDSVSDVIELSADQIKPAPALSGTHAADYVLGLGMQERRMLILVDPQRLLGGADIGLCRQLAA